IGAGLMGALLLMGVYLGIVSLAESPKHALSLFWEDKIFFIPIMIGFGIQVGLYTLLKKGWYMPLNVPAGGATTAASGGVSTFAMVACCVHHAADALPLLGLTATATFLANWKIPFMIVGLISNVIGITTMLSVIFKERGRATQFLVTPEAI
ncbi:MAG: hypothetical protein HZB77_09785, partial [Chloroflexi bacterium]|nr:hypothetical protein [Chloroflexota bacterium]